MVTRTLSEHPDCSVQKNFLASCCKITFELHAARLRLALQEYTYASLYKVTLGVAELYWLCQRMYPLGHKSWQECCCALKCLHLTQLRMTERITHLPPSMQNLRSGKAATFVGPACNKCRCSDTIRSLTIA